MLKRISLPLRIICIFLLFLNLFCKAQGKNDFIKADLSQEGRLPNTGNFSLPTSQQPGPLVSFGQNIIDKNQCQVFLFADYFKGKRKSFIDIIPSVLYGMTDDFSLFFNVPVAARYKQNKHHSSGWGDMFLQSEYAFYGNITKSYVDQATFVTNITFPTGSTKKDPETGLGSVSFFGGFTMSRMSKDWFGFTSHGLQVMTSKHHKKFGNIFSYQGGIGRNIYDLKSEWIFAGLVEVTGQYSQKDKIKGKTDPNSGGNIIYMTPSLWISSQKVIVQLGFGVPLLQHLLGNQKRNHYLIALDLGYTF